MTTDLSPYPCHTPAEAAKREAITRVHDGANEETKARILDSIREACQRLPEFTTDDLRDLPLMAEPRVLGAMMTIAKNEGLCVPTNVYRDSDHASCHGRPKRVWKSCRK